MSTNNPYLLNCVLAGVTGGNMERWLTSSNPASYSDFSNAALTLATAIDAEIPAILNGASVEDGQLLQSIVQGVIAGRNITSLVGADYTSIAQACAALFVQVQTKFDPTGNPKGTASRALPLELDANTVAMYFFNGNMDDAGPNGIHLAVATGVEEYTFLLPGLKGFVFNGATQLLAAFNAALRLQGTMSVEAIIQWSPTLPFASQVIASFNGTGVLEADNTQWQMFLTSGRFRTLWQHDIAVSENVTSITTPSFTRPSYVCISREADGSVTIYQDANAIISAGAKPLPTGGTSAVLTVGASTTPASFFSGAVNSLKISNIARSSEQVINAYIRSLGGVYGANIL